MRQVLRNPTRKDAAPRLCGNASGLRPLGERAKGTRREQSERGRWPARFRANRLYQLPCAQWHGGKWTLWAGSDAFDESRHSRLGRAHEFCRRAARMDQVTRAVQTWSAYAGDESQRWRPG